MSLFAAALRLTGLSQEEASAYLTDALGRPVSLDTIKKMSSGRDNINPDVWRTLSDLHITQVEAVEAALEQIDGLVAEHGDDFELDLSGYGRAGEWPSLRVQQNTMAMLALQSGVLKIAD